MAVLVLKPEELLELSQSDHGAAAAGLVETRLTDVCIQFLMEAVKSSLSQACKEAKMRLALCYFLENHGELHPSKHEGRQETKRK